jgi:hypothetical protein
MVISSHPSSEKMIYAVASTISSGCIWGEPPFLVVLITFVVMMGSCLR